MQHFDFLSRKQLYTYFGLFVSFVKLYCLSRSNMILWYAQQQQPAFYRFFKFAWETRISNNIPMIRTICWQSVSGSLGCHFLFQDLYRLECTGGLLCCFCFPLPIMSSLINTPYVWCSFALLLYDNKHHFWFLRRCMLFFNLLSSTFSSKNRFDSRVFLPLL